MFFRILLLFSGASCAAAQTPALSLDEAIRLAWANDPTVAALSLTPELARARAEQAGLRPNPELEVRGTLPLADEGEWAIGLGVNQRLPRRDRIERAQALAQLGGATAELHLREQRRLVAGEVRRWYYAAAVQQKRGELARRALTAQQELRDLVARRSAAGEIPAAETELAAIDVLRGEQVLALAEAELTATLQRLRTRLRLPLNSPLALQSDLDDVLARPLPSEPSSLDVARPTLALAAHHVRQADAALALARAETRGDWTLGAGVDFERRANDYTGRLENEPRLSVNASVPWPRTVANRGDIREKQAALRIAEAELAALREELNAERVAAAAEANALRPVLAAQRKVLAPDAPLLESLHTAYERGELASAQLAQLRQQRWALETDFLNAAARYVAALAEAETAAGLVPSEP